MGVSFTVHALASCPLLTACPVPSGCDTTSVLIPSILLSPRPAPLLLGHARSPSFLLQLSLLARNCLLRHLSDAEVMCRCQILLICSQVHVYPGVWVCTATASRPGSPQEAHTRCFLHLEGCDLADSAGQLSSPFARAQAWLSSYCCSLLGTGHHGSAIRCL